MRTLILAVSLLPPAFAGAEPLNLQLYRALDELHERRTDPQAVKSALEKLDEASRLSPFDAGLLWRQGRSLAMAARSQSMLPRRRSLRQALSALDHAIDIDPSLTPARYWKAYVLMERGDYSDAAAEVEAALALSPEDGAVRRLAAEIYGRASRLTVGDKKRAALELERGQKLGSGHPSLAL